MKKIGLQYIITGIFIFAGVVALIVFSSASNNGANSVGAGSVSIWGFVDSQVIQQQISNFNNQEIEITYRQISPNDYQTELVNAIASGRGPDLFLMSHQQILRNKDKIFEIPYTSFSRENYEAQYIDQAHIFLTNSGILALPLSVDPLVMFYNKSLIKSSFLIDVPEYWDELLEFSPQLTELKNNGEIEISGVALGSFNNIKNAKAIISSLLNQNNNPLVVRDISSGKFRSNLESDIPNSSEVSAVEQVFNFYTSFSRLNNSNYSWNEALPEASDMFISGDLAIYLGFASETNDFKRKNPNLDFSVSLLPQLRGTRTKSTFGNMLGFAVSKQSQNINGAILVASYLSNGPSTESFNTLLSQTPARLDLLRNRPEGTYVNLFYNSAIISSAWVDPDSYLTDTVFSSLIRNINSQALDTRSAISRAHVELNSILEKTINTTISSGAL